jgi:hypothetical protein
MRTPTMTVRRVPQDFKPTVWYEPKLHVSDMVHRKTSVSSAVVAHNGRTDRHNHSCFKSLRSNNI